MVFFITRFARQIVMQALPAMLLLLGLLAASDIQWSSVLRGILVLVAVLVFGSILSYLRFQFCITENRVLVRSGVMHKEELSIDFNRIQNITIKEPFYMRPFGLALLSIDTAGSQKKEITLGGIASPLALILRNTIFAGKRPAKPTDVDQAVCEIEPALLLDRGWRDIVIYGLSANFLLWIAVAFGVVGGSAEFSKAFYQWLSSRIALVDYLSAVQSDGNGVLGVLVIIGLVFAVVTLLPIISVIGALLRHHGYRLTVNGETYNKNSGLLNRRDESLQRHKIQAVVWIQNFVARWFGRINLQLRLTSMVANPAVQLPTGFTSSFLVPALHPDEATGLTTEFLPGCQSDQVVFSSVDRRRYTLKTLSLRWLPPILGVSIMPIILLSWKIVLLLPIALGCAWLVVNQCWKKLGYGVVGEYGFVRTGFVGTRTTVFPLFKVQRIDVRQTPFQRRAGFATLAIHLASHSLTVPYMRVEDAERFRNLALYQVESTDRPWY